jgi:hypothetical protein
MTLIKAASAHKLTETATELYTKNEIENGRIKWEKDLKKIQEDLISVIDEKINRAIEIESSKTSYSASFIISSADLSYADEYNYYHHIILEDYTPKMIDEFMDRFLDIIHQAGYKYKTEFKKHIGISPKLRLAAKDDNCHYDSLNVLWSDVIEEIITEL